MLNLPISYFLLRLGAIPETVLIVAIILSQFCLASRLYMLRGLIGLKTRDFVKKVYLNVIIVTALSSILPFVLSNFFDENFINFVMLCIVTIVSTLLIEFCIGCTPKERQFVISKVKTIIKKKYDKNK